MKKLGIVIGLLVMCLTVFITCKKDPEVNIEEFEIVTEELTVGPTSASIVGTYSYPGKVSGIKAFVADNESFAHAKSFDAELEGTTFTIEITDLKVATSYNYYYSIDYGFSNPFKTEARTFATLSESPTVKTLEVLPLDSITYRIKCEVVSGGGQDVTERGICWNTFGDPTLEDETLKNEQTGLGQYTLRMENLDWATTYYVRAYAKNATGIGFGEVLEFRTGTEVVLPQVSTVEVSGVTSNGATCIGNVSSDGGTALDECGVCWGTASNPSLNGNHQAVAHPALGVFSVSISGLNPNRTYYVRCYATNVKGTAYGEELTFTTTEGLPTVTTTGITNITPTSANGGGNVTDEGASSVTERGICWGTSHNPTISGNHASSGTGAGSYTVNMTNLTPNATYYVRAYATNAQGTSYGSEVNFTALEGLPEVSTQEVSDITATSAKGHGTVTDQGGSTVTERGICWSVEPSPTIANSHANSGTGVGSFTVNITSLTPGTKYYVRAYALNTQGTTYGDQKEFTTGANLPIVTTSAPTDVAQTTATGRGEVTNDGGSTVTERGVCWSTSHNPTTDDNHGSSGTGLGAFSVSITGLNPGITYYLRAYAVNSEGTAYGNEVSMATTADKPTVTTGAVSNITQTTALGSGNVTSDGGASVTERGICWSTSHNPTISSNHASNGTGTGGYTVNIAGLTANTTYYVRAYATNSQGTSYGNEVNFTTAETVSAPSVTTGQVTNIAQTSATGSGEVTADGGATVTERGVCWGTSHNPTTSGSHAISGTGTGTFTVNMTGLTANTAYYVRAYAKNTQGTSYGNEVNFTTSQVSTYTIAVSANPAAGGTVAGGGNYQQGQSCTVTATPATGYTFLRWTENGNQVSTNANYTFTVTGNRTLVAQFQLQSYTINVSANPTAGGTVTGGGSYQLNQSCTVTATASTGYSFVNWTEGGNPISTNASYTFTVTGNRTLVANFNQQPTWPNGVLPGAFSVGDQQVYFSQGNLQYIGSAAIPYWKFAENQWDYFETENQNGTSQSVDRDKFGWGTSGYNHGAVCYQPWAYSTSDQDYYAYGLNWTHLNDMTGQADWGYNNISNGGNQENQWRTLQSWEWVYIIDARSTPSGIRYAKANVNGINGLVLLPDDWSESYYSLNYPNYDRAEYSFNTISSSDWASSLENNGAVFLPATGSTNTGGAYWSSTGFNVTNTHSAHYMHFSSNSVYSDDGYYDHRYSRRSVRLVTNSGTSQQNYTIGVSASPINGGSVIGGGTYQQGQSCTVTASANSGFEFTSWTENGSVVSSNASYSFTVTGNRTLVANFQVSAPTGAINGLFSVSATQQVYFSQGNLQYIGSANSPYWKFADNQWDYLGTTTGQNSTYQNVDRDLFGWGTSGWNGSGATYYYPWDIADSHLYGPPGNLTGSYANADWGVFNAISNGGNTTNSWRTLTKDEWVYVFQGRANASSKYGHGSVNGQNGIILLPDNWVLPSGLTFTPGSSNWSNSYTTQQWSQMETNGAVFLPAAGARLGPSVGHLGIKGHYWSASDCDGDLAYYVYFGSGDLFTSNYYKRSYGLSVRLVQDYQR